MPTAAPLRTLLAAQGTKASPVPAGAGLTGSPAGSAPPLGRASSPATAGGCVFLSLQWPRARCWAWVCVLCPPWSLGCGLCRERERLPECEACEAHSVPRVLAGANHPSPTGMAVPRQNVSYERKRLLTPSVHWLGVFESRPHPVE